MGAKSQAVQSGQKLKVKITPFHSSPIASSDGALRNKRLGPAYGRPVVASGGLFAGTSGRLSAPPVREKVSAAAAAPPLPPPAAAAAAAGKPEAQGPSLGSSQTTSVEKAHTSLPAVKVNSYPLH